ncbi:MAG TPA: 2-oxoglutarate and iron-dependent oxygenase domain-containing protein [Xanthobacteraceae bacterium]|nr:2-oxoglutarate and iron-dependent oxygenase domain-containing protein [Xanthobacteraceae bacterium]
MLAEPARVAAPERIPLIDFAPFLSGGAAARAKVARAVAEACETIGFLYLQHHGIAPATLDGMFEAARAYFALPLAERAKEELLCTATSTRGYMPLQARHYPGTAAPDLMEAFKYQQELEPDDPDIMAGNRVHQRNRWPQGHAAFRAQLLRYFDEVTHLSHELLRAFALALDIEEDYFLQFFRKPLTQVSLLHYPPQAPAAPGDEYGIRPHADATAFTILLQDEVGGLQVKGARNDWVNAAPIPGTFVINIGDMMARWTNNRFASTMHRVFNRTGRERYSVPFFGIPDFDAVIACIPTCQGPGNPAKYPPMKVGDFMNRKNSSDWTKKDSEATGRPA